MSARAESELAISSVALGGVTALAPFLDVMFRETFGVVEGDAEPAHKPLKRVKKQLNPISDPLKRK